MNANPRVDVVLASLGYTNVPWFKGHTEDLAYELDPSHFDVQLCANPSTQAYRYVLSRFMVRLKSPLK